MTTAQGFAYTREQFQQLVDDTLQLARAAGASDAGVEVSEGAGLSVSVRLGDVETIEYRVITGGNDNDSARGCGASPDGNFVCTRALGHACTVHRSQ